MHTSRPQQKLYRRKAAHTKRNLDFYTCGKPGRAWKDALENKTSTAPYAGPALLYLDVENYSNQPTRQTGTPHAMGWRSKKDSRNLEKYSHAC